MNPKLSQAIIRKLPSKILVYLYSENIDSNQKYASGVARKLGCTYSYLVYLFVKFYEMGLIKRRFTKNNRVKYVELTDKGKIIALHLSKINELLK